LKHVLKWLYEGIYFLPTLFGLLNNKGGIKMNQDQVRNKLKMVMKECGVRANFIAKKIGYDYYNLIKFKNGQYIYDSTKLEHLDNFLNKLI
jgi:hypothetical protein